MVLPRAPVSPDAGAFFVPNSQAFLVRSTVPSVQTVPMGIASGELWMGLLILRGFC